MKKKTKKNNKKKSKFSLKSVNFRMILSLVMVFNILIIISLISKDMGIFGKLVRSFLFLFLGKSSYIIIPYINIFIFIKLKDKSYKLKSKDVYFLLISSLMISLAADFGKIITDSLSETINQAIRFDNIGLVGSLSSYLSVKVLGKTGSIVAIILTILLYLWFEFEDKIRSIFSQVKNQDFKNHKTTLNKASKEKKETKKEPVTNKKLKIIDYMDDYEIVEKPQQVKKESKLPEAISSETQGEYIKPSLDLLADRQERFNPDIDEVIKENAHKIEATMKNFSIDAKVSQINRGPTITSYELEPDPSVKISRIVSLSDNLALALASSGIRIEAPIPGKSAVGIEVPNEIKESVYLKEIINSKEYLEDQSGLPLALGKDVSGQSIVSSMDKMPHLLIAGATGSGKSVCINTILVSFLFKSSPDDLKLILIDPKVVELSVYNGIPHLLLPVVTNPKKAQSTLAWAVRHMEERYELFAEERVRDIGSYNSKVEKDKKLYKLVIVIDELADLMMVAAREIEDSISRLAQMARAAGIYLIIATQRPSVDVITGTIKANIPSRISFAVSSQIDSRTILDMGGAEKLLGQGDMLFYPSSYSKPKRIQGAFVSDDEIDRIVNFLKEGEDPVYLEEIIDMVNDEPDPDNIESRDDLVLDAIEIVVRDEQASISGLQRKLRIGYSRAARLIDDLEAMNIVGPHQGSKPREVLVTEEDLEDILEK